MVAESYLLLSILSILFPTESDLFLFQTDKIEALASSSFQMIVIVALLFLLAITLVVVIILLVKRRESLFCLTYLVSVVNNR